MNKIHVVTGIPRSGSTLLCNVLNQNPAFYAGSTSPLPELIGTFIHQSSNCVEVKSALARDGERVTLKLTRMVREMIYSWYSDRDEDVVFDKSRGWSFNAVLLHEMFPRLKLVACVRDLRNVFGSVEKQHRKTPVFDLAASPNEKTVFARADTMLAPEGLIGQSVVGVQDMMARMRDNVYVLHYEAFTMDPRTKLMEIYDFIEEPWFDHNFDNVENTSEDLDALYLNKFPHEGSGKVTPTNRGEWAEYLTPELGGLIHGRYPQYNQMFGYQ